MPPWLTLILILLAAAPLLAVLVAALMACSMLRPPRMSDAKAAWVLKRLSPGDLDLAFQPLTFTVRDQGNGRPLRLAAWWIPAAVPTDRCMILVHGYADAKVGAIAWAPMLHELGWNILAPDLRAHGESEGAFMTTGHRERHDIDQVINQLQAVYPESTRTLALLGLSLGAGVVAAVAMMREDIAAVVLDSPPADLRRSAMVHFELMGMPGELVQRLALWMTRWAIGAPFGELRPVEMIPQIPCPLMVVQSGQDHFVPPEDIALVEAALRARAAAGLPTASWKADAAEHLQSLAVHPEDYRLRLAQFLTAAVEAPG